MKKLSFLLILFILLSICVHFYPALTMWDRSVIFFVQDKLSFMPLWIPMLPDCILYTIMIIVPLLSFGIFFIRKRLYYDLVFFCSIPLVTFLLNCVIKPCFRRERPPLWMQISEVHPESYSYVSSHSLVTICLWGMVIWYLNKYCENPVLRNVGFLISVLWILFVGLSRIWLGVHNPTDVLGAYILGGILLLFYIKLVKSKLIKSV